MTKEESNQLRDGAQKAFAQLRLEVIKRSRQTGTPVVTWRNGQVCELTPEEAEQEFNSKQENRKT